MKEQEERQIEGSGEEERTAAQREENTRRSEFPQTQAAQAEEKLPSDEELFKLVQGNEGVRARVLSEYLQSLKGVPLMTGAGVTAPVQKPRSIREAGALALGYLKKK